MATKAFIAQATRQLRDYVEDFCDQDLFGVADPALLEDAPEGHRPSDLLPGVKSVVVFGRRLTDGAVQSEMRRFESDNVPAQSSYAAFARDLAPNYLGLRDVYQASQYIERTWGEVAMPLPFAEMQTAATNVMPMPMWVDPYAAGFPFDVNRAAVAAGLGQYGWSTLVLTPEYGPRIMFAAILTTLELEFSGPYNGPKLCDPATCKVCSEICPTGAIKGCGCKTQTRGVEGAQVEVTDFTRNSCIVASCAMRREFEGRVPVKNLVDTYNPTDEQLEEAYEVKAMQSLSLEHFPRYFCDRCLIYCPVGNWQERFADVGTSRGYQVMLDRIDTEMRAAALAEQGY